MRRGDIHWIDLGRPIGSEAAGGRPALLISNDGAQAAAVRRGRGVVTVVPLTSNTAVIRPFQVLLPAEATGLTADSKCQVEQLRSIDVARLGPRLGRVPAGLMARVDEALRIHLTL